jgi:hypothetical protein
MNKTFAEIQKESAEEYQSLFDFFAKNHDLVLTVGEMEDVIYAVKEHVDQRQETASAVNTIVSVPELLSLAEMVREQPKVDKMLGDNGAFAKVREQVYNECAGFIEQLAKGDKSVIEKL